MEYSLNNLLESLMVTGTMVNIRYIDKKGNWYILIDYNKRMYVIKEDIK